MGPDESPDTDHGNQEGNHFEKKPDDTLGDLRSPNGASKERPGSSADLGSANLISRQLVICFLT